MKPETKNLKTWVEVSKGALKNNVRVVRKLLGNKTKLMAVVKSNAYGHGPATAGLFSSYGVDWLGVDNIDEAISLREMGIKKSILVMGYTPPNRLKEAIQHDIQLTIYDLDILKFISKSYPPSRKASEGRSKLQATNYKLHLKIDTGMSRQGVLVSQLDRFLKSLPFNIKFEGVFSHFANADDSDRTFPNYQLSEFNKSLEIFKKNNFNPELRHMSATTGFLTVPEAHFDLVRIGIALYGLWPSNEFAKKFKNLDLQPVLSWKTRIVQIKKIKRGSLVGYGISERVTKDTEVAVLPMGYYDGYRRNLSSVGEVLIGGRRCKVLGRLSMNLTVVNISSTRDAKIWDEVVLIGKQGNLVISSEELAQRADTITYQIVSTINPLLPRIYT